MKRCVKFERRLYEYSLISSRMYVSISIHTLPEGKIKVYAPSGVSLRYIDNLVISELPRINALHEQMEKAQEAIPGTVLYEGNRVKLDIFKSKVNRLVIENENLVFYTKAADAGAVRAELIRCLSRNALENIRVMLQKWSPTVLVSYGRVTVREQRSRWGSCSSKRNLNFNWKLILAPHEVLEYVVIHELCHLICFNHSKAFWKEVAARMPEYEIWKKWLKQHGNELHV